MEQQVALLGFKSTTERDGESLQFGDGSSPQQLMGPYGRSILSTDRLSAINATNLAK
jgi:hypothetical protein